MPKIEFTEVELQSIREQIATMEQDIDTIKDGLDYAEVITNASEKIPFYGKPSLDKASERLRAVRKSLMKTFQLIKESKIEGEASG